MSEENLLGGEEPGDHEAAASDRAEEQRARCAAAARRSWRYSLVWLVPFVLLAAFVTWGLSSLAYVVAEDTGGNAPGQATSAVLGMVVVVGIFTAVFVGVAAGTAWLVARFSEMRERSCAAVGAVVGGAFPVLLALSLLAP